MNIPMINKVQIRPGVYHATVADVQDTSIGRHNQPIYRIRFRVELGGGRSREVTKFYRSSQVTR